MKRILITITILLASIATAYTPPVEQGLPVVTGYVGSAVISVGFGSMYTIQGATNNWDRYVPFVASELLVGPIVGETRSLLVTFSTNVITTIYSQSTPSVTNTFTPTWFTVGEGQYLNPQKKVQRIFLKGPCDYQIMIQQ